MEFLVGLLLVLLSASAFSLLCWFIEWQFKDRSMRAYAMSGVMMGLGSVVILQWMISGNPAFAIPFAMFLTAATMLFFSARKHRKKDPPNNPQP